jgi:2'-5' RNA ligase
MPVQRALVVFPEGDGLHAVESLRHRFDPLAGIIAAHATLVFPFGSELSATDLRGHIERAIDGQREFRARFEGVVEIDDEYVFLDATVGAERLVDLHDRLYRDVLAQHLSRAHEYRPHITIGRVRDSGARASALIAARELSPVVETVVSAVAVFRLDGEGGRVEFVVKLPWMDSDPSVADRYAPAPSG